jgi:hypothetical protein
MTATDPLVAVAQGGKRLFSSILSVALGIASIFKPATRGDLPRHRALHHLKIGHESRR